MLGNDFNDFYRDHKKNEEENEKLKNIMVGNNKKPEEFMAEMCSKFNWSDMMQKLQDFPLNKQNEENQNNLKRKKEIKRLNEEVDEVSEEVNKRIEMVSKKQLQQENLD